MSVRSAKTAVTCAKPLRENERVIPARACRRARSRSERDLLLDLDRRQRRRDRVDLHLDVGDVGNGVDRQLRQRPDAGGRRRERDQQDQPAATDRESEDPLDHRSVLVAAALASSALSRKRVGRRDGLAGLQTGDDLRRSCRPLRPSDDVALLEARP